MTAVRHDLLGEIAALRERCEELEEENRFLREEREPQDRFVAAVAVLGVRPWTAPVLHMLMTRQAVHRDVINDAYEPTSGNEQTAQKYCHVVVWKLRRALAPYGIGIETIWGWGYRMAPEHQARLIALVEDRGKL